MSGVVVASAAYRSEICTNGDNGHDFPFRKRLDEVWKFHHGNFVAEAASAAALGRGSPFYLLDRIMSLTIFSKIKAKFIVSWIIGWNLLLGLGVFLDRGAPREEAIFFSAMSSIALFCTSITCFLVIFTPKIQSITLRENTSIDSTKRELFIIGAIAGLCSTIAALGTIMRMP